MFVTNGPNTIAHEEADCHRACCKQLRKPDKIVTLPSLMCRQSANLMNKSVNLKSSGIGFTQSQGKVISISAAIRSARQARAEKVGQAKFNYPMLECS